VTDEAALLRAVLEHPDCDTPRLVYADWCDENGQEDRAEFIRVECRVSIPPWDSRDIIRGANLWVALRGQLATSLPAIPGGHQWAVHAATPAGVAAYEAIFRRGFVDEVRLPLAAFVAGECERCRGQGAIEPGRGSMGQACSIECSSCSGIGTTLGLAQELFAAHPIVTVRLTDRDHDYSSAIAADMGHPRSKVSWRLATSARDLADPNYHEYLPAELWNTDYISGVNRHGRRQARLFKTPAAAHTALSTACVAYGRQLAGLPPLEPIIQGA
jgi:uncharacterized protein (TIGR02996 family)